MLVGAKTLFLVFPCTMPAIFFDGLHDGQGGGQRNSHPYCHDDRGKPTQKLNELHGDSQLLGKRRTTRTLLR